MKVTSWCRAYVQCFPLNLKKKTSFLSLLSIIVMFRELGLCFSSRDLKDPNSVNFSVSSLWPSNTIHVFSLMITKFKHVIQPAESWRSKTSWNLFPQKDAFIFLSKPLCETTCNFTNIVAQLSAVIFLANQTTQTVQRSKKKSPQGLKYF